MTSVIKFQLEGIFLFVEIWFDLLYEERLTNSSLEIRFVPSSKDFDVLHRNTAVFRCFRVDEDMRRVVLVAVFHRSFDDSASCLSNVARVAFLVTTGYVVCYVVLIFVLRFVFDGEFRTQLCWCIRDAIFFRCLVGVSLRDFLHLTQQIRFM